ncbi:Leucine-rich repeat-containing protein 34 [Geranomyces variabilis]|uniref:Leucine-rich repeat-containing protein 34 n=1 Tax=Geranomyces variabilis TaxID=109894 RepID=A0AAD5TRK8_9FUNG|nr:Leucine-rich repeat-containing protein 34 [Geranomyces variabilis]
MPSSPLSAAAAQAQQHSARPLTPPPPATTTAGTVPIYLLPPEYFLSYASDKSTTAITSAPKLPPPPPSYKTVFPSYVAADYDPDATILKRESWAGPNVSYVGAQLTTEELFTILNHLAQNKSARNLYLGGNNSALTDYAMPHLVRALKQNSTLVSLRIDRCSLGDAAGGMLGMILRENKTLQILNVRDNALGATGMQRFADALAPAAAEEATTTPPTTTTAATSCKLKELDLSANAIGDDGAQHLAMALLDGRLPLLETLHLNFDGIGNPGALALAQVVECSRDDGDGQPRPPSPRLRVLYLNENVIGIAGAQRLAAAAARNPHFRRVSLLLNANLTRVRTRSDAALRVKGALSSLFGAATAAAANRKIITH